MHRVDLTYKDLELFFCKPKKRTFLSFFLTILKSIFVFALLFSLTFLGMNFKAYLSKAIYFWKYDVLKTHIPKKEVKAAAFLPTVKEQSPEEKLVPEADNNKLFLPRLNIVVPIHWDTDWDNASIQTNLREGVIQMKDTAKPDQTGNVFIAGHSSASYWDKKQKFAQVFANLDKLQKGDMVKVTYKNREYIYEVKDSLIVDKNDISVAYPTETPTLSLMTCTPTGTNFKRLVVRSSLKSGELFQDQKTPKTPAVDYLPLAN